MIIMDVLTRQLSPPSHFSSHFVSLSSSSPRTSLRVMDGNSQGSQSRGWIMIMESFDYSLSHGKDLPVCILITQLRLTKFNILNVTSQSTCVSVPVSNCELVSVAEKNCSKHCVMTYALVREEIAAVVGLFDIKSSPGVCLYK